MATPAKRQCLGSNSEEESSKPSFVVHSSDCRGTIEEADALAAEFLAFPNVDKSSSGNYFSIASIKSNIS
jgi:hypothetical protein